MYPYRKKRLPVTAWLVPLCIILIAAAALVVDYTHQHVRVSVFGQSVDAQTVRQIMVVPSSTDTGTSTPTYAVNGHGQIIGLLRDLSAAHPAASTNQDVIAGKEIEIIYIELQSGTWHLTLLQSHLPGHVLVQYKNQFFTADAGLLTLLQKP